MDAQSWLLFLPQLPSTPSSLRVQVWRRMRVAGALGLQNGVWVLPQIPAYEQVLQEILTYVEHHGGSGMLFVSHPLDAALDAGIIARFRADRDQEYREFCQRCADLCAELGRETEAENFSFAELEENEQDLQKLEDWLRKIQARDVFGGHAAANAAVALAAGRQALQTFTGAVYRREGLVPGEVEVIGPET